MSWMTTVQCDHCGTTRTDPAERRWIVAIHLDELGWRVDDNFHLCPDCKKDAA